MQAMSRVILAYVHRIGISHNDDRAAVSVRDTTSKNLLISQSSALEFLVFRARDFPPNTIILSSIPLVPPTPSAASQMPSESSVQQPAASSVPHPDTMATEPP